MGNANKKEDLYSAINSDNIQETTKLIKENPNLINEPMTDDCLSTPISRAAWRGNVDMIYTLINLGADVNLTMKDRLTPLQVAARRGKDEAVDYLIQKGADIHAVSHENLTALDYAIIYTNYNVCKKLMNLGCQPKNVEVYHKVKTEKIPYNYDYEKMIECLNLGLTQSECPSFVIEPQEKVYRDPVIDPRETWNAYIKRIANFDEPPLVERSELPPELQPQNRLFGKVMKLVTGKSSVEEKENNEAENGNPEESVRLTPRGKNKLNEIELPDNLPSAKDQTTDEILPETKQKIDIQVDIKKEEME